MTDPLDQLWSDLKETEIKGCAENVEYWRTVVACSNKIKWYDPEKWRYLYLILAVTFIFLGIMQFVNGEWLWGLVDFALTGMQGFNYWMNNKILVRRRETRIRNLEALKEAEDKLIGVAPGHALVPQVIEEEPEL